MAFFAAADGVRLHFEESGEGRALVFLHGWGMSGRVWHFQQELADRHRLVFLDLRGHGASSAAESYTMEGYTRDLEEFLEHLDLQDATLVGWSMGAQVALAASPRLRSRVASLVLVGATPRFTTAPDYAHGKPPIEVKGMGLSLRRDYQRTLGEFFKGMFTADEVEGAQYQRIAREIVAPGRSPDAAAVLAGLALLGSVDLRPLLPHLDLPVLLVHGDGDTICPPSAAAFMAQSMPNAIVKVMKGCGHAPFMTRPEEFNDAVREFMQAL